MANTLGLVGDGDDNELMADLEAAFGGGFSQHEAETLRTVGDLYRVLQDRFSARGDAARGCPTAMAFYRLRRGCSEMGIASTLRPATALTGLSARTAREFLNEVRRRTGLQLPPVEATCCGRVGLTLAVSGVLILISAVLLKANLWLVPLLICGGGLLFMRLEPGRFPTGSETLGDLARKVAALNFGRLFIDGAGHRDKDLWNALLEILSRHTALPMEEIRLETEFIENQRRVA